MHGRIACRLALPGEASGAPPRCHGFEEELFVVLDGEGPLELWQRPNPDEPQQSEPAESHPLRRATWSRGPTRLTPAG